MTQLINITKRAWLNPSKGEYPNSTICVQHEQYCKNSEHWIRLNIRACGDRQIELDFTVHNVEDQTKMVAKVEKIREFLDFLQERIEGIKFDDKKVRV